MKAIFIVLFTFLSLASFGQNKKVPYEILHSPGSPDIYIGYSAICSAPYKPLEKRKIDSLQIILNNLNINNRVKEYFYSMKIYSDYSYDLEREYKIHTNLLKDIDGATISGEEYRKFPQD